MTFALQTLFELALVIIAFWCIFNEDRLIAFEKNLASLIRRKRLKVVRNKALENI
ncbi:MAG: hypothetical protein IJD55_01525 [Clostridia bacterium]|nr:hypothetical protein [Clostridia bacterium]